MSGVTRIYEVTGIHKTTGKRVKYRIRAHTYQEAEEIAKTQLKKPAAGRVDRS